MSLSSSFLWRFLDDVWDLLPTEDRELFQAYWRGQIRIASGLEHRILEISQSTLMAEVPVFLTERWNRFVMNEDTCDLFQQMDALLLAMTADTPLSRQTAFFETLTVSSTSGRILHEEQIRFFDNSVRYLRYGKIVNGGLTLSFPPVFQMGAGGATVTSSKRLTKAGFFAGVRPGMQLKISAPASVAGTYTIESHVDDDFFEIAETFPIPSIGGVVFEIFIRGVEFTPGRDFAVNLEAGTIQALDEGRIPPTEMLTVRYWHTAYTRDLDYVVNTLTNAVARTATGTIPDGATVAVGYTYNGTVTIPLEGTAGAVEVTTLTDTTKNFSSLLPGRTLTIASGPNAGAYPINAVLGPTQVQVVGTFPVTQATDVAYSINAFPHGVRVDARIASIPLLQDLVDEPTSVLIENVDYRVLDGVLALRAPLLLSSIGPEDQREHQAWAEETKINLETPYRNFGVLIDFFRANSEEYKLALQGLWYAFWTGSTPNNLERGLHILLGLPFAKRAGTVTRVDVTAQVVDVTDARGQTLTYAIPSGLDPVVAVNDAVDRFDSLTTGVRIIDRNNEPGFVANRLGRAGIQQFLTSNASRGVGDSDETRALALLEHHLFLPQVLVEAITRKIDVTELVTFLDNMKPQWTSYVFSFAVEQEETLTFSEQVDPLEVNIDLTTTVSNNQWNQSFQFNNFPVQRITGEIIAGGTQATGNFRDLNVDFAALDIDRDDTVRIRTGPFLGYHRVLKRVSVSVLSLDIPDGMIFGYGGLDYVVIPSERLPDNDAIGLQRENIILPGTAFTAPSVLNTKSDAGLAGTSLTVNEVRALLLVDVANAGGRVQAITNANLTAYEITVAAPPPVVVRAHAICSCALMRTNNAGPTVTDAFAI